MKKLLAFALVSLMSTVAYAQDDMGGGEEGGGDTGGGDTGGGDTAAAPAPAADGATDYKMGIGVVFPTGGDGAHANFLWGMGKNYLDLSVGVNFSKGPVVDPMGMTSDESIFGVDLGVGYRMYKPMKGKIRPYLEPFGNLSIGSFADAGPTLTLAVGALMGVDYQLWEQFTLGTGIGAVLVFDNDGTDPFKVIDFGLVTSPIIATFWW